VLTPGDYDDIIVTAAHPYADIETTPRQWIETGPGPRPFSRSPPRAAAMVIGYHSRPFRCSTTTALRVDGFSESACLRLLLQLDTDDDLGWMWGEVGRLYYLIRQEDLAARDFSHAWMTFQCG
jgi:hypothetical protein